MRFLDRFESAIEKGVQGTFSRIFRSELKPVDVSSAVRSAMDNHVQEYSRDRAIAPNQYTVRVAPSDMKRLEELGIDVLATEVENTAREHAEENNFALVGPIDVNIEEGPEELTGELEIEVGTKRGAVAPATSQVATESNPIIDVEGERWILTEPVTILGRGAEADITISDSGVSRRHLELRKTPDGVIASDLGSTNGLYVEGHKVDAATLVDGHQLVIGRTRILFWTSAAKEQYT